MWLQLCASLVFFFLLQGTVSMWTFCFSKLERRVSVRWGAGAEAPLAPHFPKGETLGLVTRSSKVPF